jgi:hypothetical protein
MADPACGCRPDEPVRRKRQRPYREEVSAPGVEARQERVVGKDRRTNAEWMTIFFRGTSQPNCVGMNASLCGKRRMDRSGNRLIAKICNDVMFVGIIAVGIDVLDSVETDCRLLQCPA